MRKKVLYLLLFLTFICLNMSYVSAESNVITQISDPSDDITQITPSFDNGQIGYVMSVGDFAEAENINIINVSLLSNPERISIEFKSDLLQSVWDVDLIIFYIVRDITGFTFIANEDYSEVSNADITISNSEKGTTDDPAFDWQVQNNAPTVEDIELADGQLRINTSVQGLDIEKLGIMSYKKTKSDPSGESSAFLDFSPNGFGMGTGDLLYLPLILVVGVISVSILTILYVARKKGVKLTLTEGRRQTGKRR